MKNVVVATGSDVSDETWWGESFDAGGGLALGLTPPKLGVNVKYRFKTKPFRHQVKALRRGMKQDAIGVLWEPGTGKSKFIVDWACILHLKRGLKRVLIVCPLSVMGVWEDEFNKHSPIPYHIQFLARNTSAIERVDGLNVVVVNYDLAWRRKDLLYRYDPQLVVAD